jgi:3-oxoacyl-[acyl-carrier-protein] synthase II
VPREEVVITGIGAATPIGIGRQCAWEHFCAGASGVAPIRSINREALPARIAGEVKDFDPRAYVKQRKTLKVMCRDSQLAVAAADLACRDAGIEDGAVDPSRFGVVLGADRICSSLEDSELIYRPCMVDGRFDFSRWGPQGIASGFPLCFLKVLPNMVSCQVSINQDAQGPNNTIHQCVTSSLQAVIEAARVIQRGRADVMIAGGASSMLNPYDWSTRWAGGRLSPRSERPPEVMRPFDALRDGEVAAEGAACYILESGRYARARKARILARFLGGASAAEPAAKPAANSPLLGTGLQRAMRLALAEAGLRPPQIGHINAQGASLVLDDQIEARAIHACLPDVPVTAPRSYFGNAGAAAGALELIASVMAVAEGRIPATLNYECPDPRCPIPVVHSKPLVTRVPTALAINWTGLGQAVALVLAGP